MNTIKKDIFSENEIKSINDSIKKELDLIQNNKIDFLKNLEINNLKINSMIQQKIFWIAKELYAFNNSYIKKLSNVRYIEYKLSNELNPNFNINMDGTSTENPGLILNYQLESNIKWPLTIQDEDHVLVDNSLVPIFVNIQKYERPNITWNPDSFVKLLFFEFDILLSEGKTML